MATEKGKTKAAAVKMYLDEHPALGKNGPVDWEQIEFAMRFAAAARADAIEECATKIERDWPTSDTAKTIANRVRSLSRKQEEPR